MSDNRKILAVWKPKIAFDEDMLQRVNQFYSAGLDSSACGVECFSHPSFGSHECNTASKLVGGADCQFCSHIFGRSCPITCHISQFCMMVFAYRLGIGGDDLEESLAFTGGMYHETLYKLIQQRIHDVEELGPDAKVIDGKQMTFPFYNSFSKGIAVKEVRQVVEKSEEDNEYITLNEAAKLYGCSYVNIYSHVRRGRLCAKTVRGVKQVSKAEVLKLKEELNGAG